jgi:hypothetical protein
VSLPTLRERSDLGDLIDALLTEGPDQANQ